MSDARFDLRVQAVDQVEPSGGSGDGVAGDGVFQAGEPRAVLAALGQQAVAAANGVVVGGDFAGVAWLQRPNQAVEEAAAAGQAFLEQPVHLRGEPDGGNQTGNIGLIAGGNPVQAEDTAVEFSVRSGTDAGFAILGVKAGVDGPAARTTQPGQVGVAGTSKAAAWHQQRQGFQQVGLAAAVRAVQHADARGRTPDQRGVAAEIGQGQAMEAEHSRKMASGRCGVKTLHPDGVGFSAHRSVQSDGVGADCCLGCHFSTTHDPGWAVQDPAERSGSVARSARS